MMYKEEHDKFLIENVKGITCKELTERFNKKFGTNVNEESISNRKTRLHISSGITGGQFQKGQKSFNKGKKWDEFMSEQGKINSSKTTFKKGNRPSNAVPIGTERLRNKTYIAVKVCDGKKNKNWVLKHKLIYEQHYGPIPDGYKVIFADGNNRNFDINNLILVTNSEELIMNKRKLIYKDAELTKSGHLVAKIIDKQNKLRRK